MILIPVEVRPSAVHGLGLFATVSVPAGTVLWRYVEGIDRRVPADSATPQQLHFGYVNPRRPQQLVICGDLSRYWNFPPQDALANCGEGLVDPSGEAAIIALRDLRAGEELLIDLASDADATRKLNLATAA